MIFFWLLQDLREAIMTALWEGFVAQQSSLRIVPPCDTYQSVLKGSPGKSQILDLVLDVTV